MLFTPSAVARLPVAFAFVPTAVAFAPLAWAFTPHPNDDADADAPLLLAVTELTTGVFIGVTAVRTGAVVTITSLTTPLGPGNGGGGRGVTGGMGVTLTPVIALANVGAVVPGVKVKKLFAVGALTLVTNVCGDTTVPLTTGTVSSVTSGVFIWLTN
jgi:hypothetical protein